MAEKKILFEPKPDSPRVTRISHGQYTRDFTEEKPPYAATVEEWEIYIRPTVFFRVGAPRAAPVLKKGE